MLIERRTSRRRWRLGAMAALLGLAACNPVETWRDWSGASQNDPDPETTPNTRNLAAGEASDYPNLATVPPPPVRAMTAAERQKLTQSLVADRTNARYSDEQLRAGFAAASAPPPPPPNSVAAEPAATQSMAVAPAPPAAASASSSPVAASEPLGGDTGAGEKPVTPSPAAATRSASVGGKTPAKPGQNLRKQGEPPEPGPVESSLEIPQARATPQPEEVQPAPAAPQLPPSPKVASTAKPPQGGLAAGGALAPIPLTAAKGSGGFEPAPPPPELPAAAPPRSAAADTGTTGPKPPAPAATPLAEIKFPADSASLTDGDRHKLETLVPLYQQNPGRVRIVGYADTGSSAVEQLNGYRAALDRAQAVAAALTKAGIPSDKVQVEAAPTGSGSGEGRAEVLLEH